MEQPQTETRGDVTLMGVYLSAAMLGVCVAALIYHIIRWMAHK
jgi:hypothetical protein